METLALISARRLARLPCLVSVDIYVYAQTP
jgi:hypothetical protein